MGLFDKRSKRLLGALFISSLIAILPDIAAAETAASEFALFKRTMTPVWQWGENGILTVPKAPPIGKYNIYAALSGQEAGEIQGEKLYNTNASIVIGTSDDAEIGYTRRQLIWKNGDRTDLESDVFHIKTRVINLAEFFIPQLSVGVIGSSLRDNQFTDTKEILFNPFAAATVNIPLFSKKHRMSITGVAETLYSSGEATDAFYDAGLDISFFDNTLTFMAEYQGIDKEAADVILNAGAKLKLFDFLNIGGGMFNMSQSKKDNSVSQNNAYTMAFVSVELPLGRWNQKKGE